MTMTPEQQRAIIQRESAWIDDSLGQLDLSAFPALNELPKEEAAHDDRFAKSYGDTALGRSSTDLKRFLADPDMEALARVGSETGNPEYLTEVRDKRAELVAQEFRRKCPQYLACDENLEAISSTLAFNTLPSGQQDCDTDELISRLVDAGAWTVDNLVACYKALSREGLLEVPAGTARSLTESERLFVMRLAQNGRFDEAIGEYLKCALDGEEPTMDIITDPNYAALCNEAVLYVFEVGEVSYTPTPERRAFLLRYAAGRPLTFNLLTQAWQTLKQREASYARQEVLDQFQRPQTPEPPANLDALGDEEVDQLYKDSIRAYAQSFKRAPGVLA